MSRLAKVVAVLFALPVAVQAEITGVALGTAAPPAELGGYTMIPFPPDERTLLEDVTWVSGPTGDIEFDIPMSHRRIGHGWSTWSHGYRGDVYYTYSAREVTLALPPGTGAFMLYAELNYGQGDMIATANDGTSVTQYAYWSYGAVGFGFYTDGSTDLTSITVSTYRDFAVGEFSTAAIPEPGTLGLFVFGGLALMRRR
jgi:hypothetical protein